MDKEVLHNDYELLDSGEEYKLERYGKFVVSRPDPQALWKKSLPQRDWSLADAYFVQDKKGGIWKTRSKIPESWIISYDGIKFKIKLTSFKHTGLFPEQSFHWSWMTKTIKKCELHRPKILNLFGYTGAASVFCAQQKAHVTHVDASKSSVKWASENAELSNVQNSIRFIVDDALEFCRKEIRRGNTYEGIVMDPPAFGRGPNGEVWQIEKSLPELFSIVPQLLSKTPLFVVASGYAAGYSPRVYEYNLWDALFHLGGSIESGELGIQQTNSNRILPCGMYSRWSA